LTLASAAGIAEDVVMPFTLADFDRWFFQEHFAKLTPEEQQEFLKSLPPEKRLAGLSPEQIRDYLEQLTGGRPAKPPGSRRKK
jgi:hypothetical protein